MNELLLNGGQSQRTTLIRKYLAEQATLRSKANPRGLRDGQDAVMRYSLDVTDGRCAYCGVGIARRNKNTGKWESSGHGDHLYPASKGSPYMEGGIVYSCKACNGRKNDHDPIEFLTYLHATSRPEDLFMEDLNGHVALFKERFIEPFVRRVPDQILKIMMAPGSGVDWDDIDLITRLNDHPELMEFTEDLQDGFVARSLAYKKDFDKDHKELLMQAFPLYDDELRKLVKIKGKNHRSQYYSSFTVFNWLVSIPEETGWDPQDVTNIPKVLEDHKNDAGHDMKIAGAVYDFMRPVMLSLRQRVGEVRAEYDAKLQEWRDSGEAGPEPSDQSAATYNNYTRSWNLLMKCFLVNPSPFCEGDPDREALIRNCILPPSYAGLGLLMDLPESVDPVSRLRFMASMILDDRKDIDYLRIDPEEPDGEPIVLDMGEWLPNDLAAIKTTYEGERDRNSTITGRKKKTKSYKHLAWGINGFKDDIIVRMLMAGDDLVDDDGNFNCKAFGRAMLQKAREDVWLRNEDGELRLPASSASTNYGSASMLYNSLCTLSTIVLGWKLPKQIEESTLTKLINDEDALPKLIEAEQESQSVLLEIAMESMDDEAFDRFMKSDNYDNLTMNQLKAGLMRLKKEHRDQSVGSQSRENELRAKLQSVQEELEAVREERDKTQERLDLANVQLKRDELIMNAWMGRK